MAVRWPKCATTLRGANVASSWDEYENEIEREEARESIRRQKQKSSINTFAQAAIIIVACIGGLLLVKALFID